MDKLVSKNTAILAKQVGFDAPKAYDYSSGLRVCNSTLEINEWALPTQTQLAKWLRDIKGILIVIDVGVSMEPDGCIDWFNFKLRSLVGEDDLDEVMGFSSYEEAMESALESALCQIE